MASDIRIVETDEIGNLTASYVSSSSKSSESRIDVIHPPSQPPWRDLLDVFLPSGYPHSVTEDYLEFVAHPAHERGLKQADTRSMIPYKRSQARLQDYCQAGRSLKVCPLTERSLHDLTNSGVGVGDATASTTSAVLLSILQESLGRVTTILFAHRLGTSLEPECKTYRLLADIFNDTAMILECLSPAFPKTIRVVILASSSALKALCGVAAGSSKASLSAHFAKWGNLGELNAKDSSQETVVSLLGMLAGSIVVSRITSIPATWTALLLLLAIHLMTNYRAVKAVTMRTLNRQRAGIVMARHIHDQQLLSPEQVATHERIFDRNGAVRDIHGCVIGYCRIGVSWNEMLRQISKRQTSSGAATVDSSLMKELFAIFDKLSYVLWLDQSSKQVWIVLKKDCSVLEQIGAWDTTVCLLIEASNPQPKKTEKEGSQQVLSPSNELSLLASIVQRASKTFPPFAEQLKKAGWDLETGALLTRQPVFVQVQ